MKKDENYVVGVGQSRDDVKNINRTKRVLAKYNREQTIAIGLGTAMGNILTDVFHKILGTIQSATYAVKSFANSLTIEPMREGLNEYETMLTTIRTMTMNAEGWYRNLTDEAERYAASQNDVTSALDSLNNYADKTIYKFSDMTMAAQRFVTQGLTISDSEEMTRGIASLTAYLGGDANAYSTAITAFSHSMSQGRMYAREYNELASANLVGERMKELLIDSAKILGKDVPDTFSDAYHPDDGEGFKQTVSDWVDGSVLLVALGKIMGGTYETTEQLKESLMSLEAEHGMTIDESFLTDEFLQRMLEFRDNAFDASTQVKTLSQFMDALKESIATGWTKIWSSFFGDFNQASKMWTDLLELITDPDKGNNIGSLMDSVVKSMDEDFVSKNGYEKVSNILTNVWYIIKGIGGSIGKIFSALSGGKKIGEVIYTIVDKIEQATDFISGMFGEKSMDREMMGFKDIMEIVTKYMMLFVSIFKQFISIFRNFFAKIAPPIARMLATALEWIYTQLETIYTLLEQTGVLEAIDAWFGMIGDVLGGAFDQISSVFSGIQSALTSVKSILSIIIETIKTILVEIFSALSDVFNSITKDSSGNEKSLWSIIKTITLIGIITKLMSFITKNVKPKDFLLCALGLLAITVALRMLNDVDFANGKIEQNFETLLKMLWKLAFKLIWWPKKMVGSMKEMALTVAAFALFVGSLFALALLLNSVPGLSRTVETAAKALGFMAIGFATLILSISALIVVILITKNMFNEAGRAMVETSGSIQKLELAFKGKFEVKLKGLETVGIALMIGAIALAIKTISDLTKGISVNEISLANMISVVTLMTIFIGGIFGAMFALVSMLSKPGINVQKGLSVSLELKAVADVLTSLAGIILTLSLLSWTFKGGDIAQVVGTVVIFAGVVTVLMALISSISKGVGKVPSLKKTMMASKNYLMIALLFHSIASLLSKVILSLSILSLSMNDTVDTSIIAVLAVLGIILKSLVVVFASIKDCVKDTAGIFKMGFIIGAISTALAVILISLSALAGNVNDKNMASLVTSLSAILVVVVLFSAIAIALGALQGYAGAGAGILMIVSAAIALLSGAAAVLAYSGTLFGKSMVTIVDSLVYAAEKAAPMMIGLDAIVTAITLITIATAASSIAIPTLLALSASISLMVTSINNLTTATSGIYDVIGRLSMLALAVNGFDIGVGSRNVSNGVSNLLSAFSDVDTSGLDTLTKKFERFSEALEKSASGAQKLSSVSRGFSGGAAGFGVGISNRVAERAIVGETSKNTSTTEKMFGQGKMYLVMEDGAEFSVWLDDKLGSKLRGGN